VQEKQKADAASNATGGTKLTSGELRLQKDVSELNLSKGTTIEFPNGKVGFTGRRGSGVVRNRDEQGADCTCGAQAAHSGSHPCSTRTQTYDMCAHVPAPRLVLCFSAARDFIHTRGVLKGMAFYTHALLPNLLRSYLRYSRMKSECSFTVEQLKAVKMAFTAFNCEPVQLQRARLHRPHRQPRGTSVPRS
jgi:hypothetical protein